MFVIPTHSLTALVTYCRVRTKLPRVIAYDRQLPALAEYVIQRNIKDYEGPHCKVEITLYQIRN